MVEMQFEPMSGAVLVQSFFRMELLGLSRSESHATAIEIYQSRER